MKKFTLLCIILISFSLGQIKNGPIIGKTNNKQIKTNKIEDLSSGVVPRRISYQGFLTKADGTPTIDGSYEILFKVYDNAEEGEPIWSESQLVNVSNGIISTVLGNTIPFSVIPENAYLELTVDGSTLSPRQLLTSVFYSILSDTSGYAKTANYDDLQNKPDLHVYVLKDSLESYTTSADLYDTLSYYQSLDSNLTDLTEDGILSAEKVEYGISSPGSTGQSWISDGEGSGQWGVPTSLLSDGDINIIPGDSSIIRLDSNLVVNNGVVGNENDPDLVTFLPDTLKVSGAIVVDNVSGDAVLDEDDMVSDSDSKLATQQSIKAYVDTKLNTGSSLETISDLDLSDGNFIVADGEEWSVESDSVARNSLGLGSISTQDSVNINMDGGFIDGTIIGSENPSSATFTTLNSSEAT
ncbi:MAG: hypothetical protein ACJZ1Q_06240, partial [Candidatus Neomarinimicrobiota bacterium]